MHVLIGGCGWLGLAVARRLLERGDRVTGIRRRPDRASALASQGIEPLAADLSDWHSAQAVIGPDVDAVVVAAAPHGEGVAAYRAAYVETNANLLEAATARTLSAYVYTSSTGVFGQTDGEWVREDTPAAPASPTAEVLVEAERLVLGAAPVVPTRVVRLSGLYGPGRTGTLERVRAGRLGLGPGDDVWMNFCHQDDAATAVVAALDRGRPGGVYHATDASPSTRREVVEWVAERLGIPAPHAPPPPGPNRRIDGHRTRDELGFALRFPSFREGFSVLL